MRVLTNPGSNLSPAETERYGILLTPQTIMVEGTAFDTHSSAMDFATIDAWVSRAKVHPYVVGTTAAEFIKIFHKMADGQRQICAIMTSRKLIGSYDAALSARKTLLSHKANVDLEIGVFDTGVTDVGAGLAAILAGAAAREGMTHPQIEQLIEAFRQHARMLILPETLDYLVKGGRATPVRAWIADMLSVRPMLAFVDGEVAVVSKVRTRTPSAMALAEQMQKDLGEGRPVWMGVCHGGADEEAAILEHELRKRFDVRFAMNRPLSPSIYLHAGPGSVAAVVIPLDSLPFVPNP